MWATFGRNFCEVTVWLCQVRLRESVGALGRLFDFAGRSFDFGIRLCPATPILRAVCRWVAFVPWPTACMSSKRADAYRANLLNARSVNRFYSKPKTPDAYEHPAFSSLFALACIGLRVSVRSFLRVRF